MFPSSNSYIAVPYTDQAMFDKPFDNDVSPYSKNPLPSSFFEFSPFVDPNDDDIEYFQHHHQDLFMTHFPKHHHHPQLITSSDTIAETEINTTASNKINNNNFMDETAKKSFPMPEQMLKKSVKKDRHSKIATAQGLRDRRMRLSLEVAHKFFSLQDMLGYDKASKTIEWLFTKSKVAIRELYRELSQTKNSCNHGNKSVSSASECEVVSGIEDIANNEDEKAFEGKFSTGICKEKRARNSRKPKFHPLARESRAKARARARERTMEKRWNKSQLCPKATTLDELNQLGSSSPFETGEESGSHSHDMKSSSLEVVAEVEEPSSHSLECQGPMDNMVEESYVITSKLSPSTIFDYHHEIAISHGMNPNFTENWDIDTTRSQYSFSAMTNLMRPSTGNIQECIPSPFSLTSSDTRFQSQFADIQYKPWEIYNNQSLSRP